MRRSGRFPQRVLTTQECPPQVRCRPRSHGKPANLPRSRAKTARLHRCLVFKDFLTFFPAYVLVLFVIPQPAIADQPFPSDPPPDRSSGDAPVPDGIAGLLCLLRWIIGRGQQLAATLQQNAPGPDRSWFVFRYRTRDLAAVLTRIQRGLMLAAGLQDRLVRRAATGRDVAPVPLRDPQPRQPGEGEPQRKRTGRRICIVDLPLDRLPAAQEIAEELRYRPIGAILVDICRDLGILPGDLPGALQELLSDSILQYGGCLVVLLFKEQNAHIRKLIAAQRSMLAAPSISRPRSSAAGCSTGPP